MYTFVKGSLSGCLPLPFLKSPLFFLWFMESWCLSVYISIMECQVRMFVPFTQRGNNWDFWSTSFRIDSMCTYVLLIHMYNIPMSILMQCKSTLLRKMILLTPASDPAGIFFSLPTPKKSETNQFPNSVLWRSTRLGCTCETFLYFVSPLFGV